MTEEERRNVTIIFAVTLNRLSRSLYSTYCLTPSTYILVPVAAAGPYFLVAEQESKQRSQLRGGVDRKAFLFAVTSLSCGSPTLSHPPLRTPPGPRRYSGQRSGERDGRAVEPNRGLPRRFAARNDSLICSINCKLTERYVTE